MSSPKITRRQILGGAAAGAALSAVGCKKDYFNKSEAEFAGDEQIVRAEIHPGIGVARIGNSAEGMFIGPEVVEPALTAAGASRDGAGAIKRQAARFRIYGYNAQGQIVREITGENADVDWFVQLANKKAAWYRFIAALDLPEAASLKSPRRNASVTNRASLIAGGGTKTIKGKNISGVAYRFDTSLFGASLSLGEVRTDAQGRLLVLGGLGKSGSPANKPIYVETDGDSFNNADGWFDDVADGPVTAVVHLGGRQIPVESAWVIVAPPNYAPDVIGWRTMHDLLIDTFIDAGMLAPPATTSFTKDVLPALRRLSNLQWVNKGFSDGYRKGLQFDFEDASSIANLNKRDSGDTKKVRDQIRGSFRPPGKDRRSWPWIYGDAYGSFDTSDKLDLSASQLRALHLERWANGEFIDDWDPKAKPIQTLEQVPLGEQPAMLDKAALHFCLADAFHPGCELTWPMRHATMYSAPFRVKQRKESEPEPDYGKTLTQTIALGANGPLGAQAAGDLTRWMALPWQGDTVFCRSGYEPQYDPYLPTFWPARVPNHVLTADDYATAMNTSLPREQRLAAFRNRESWVRRMQGNPPAQMLQMVREFGMLGVVEARPGPDNDPDLPAQMFVESLGPVSRGGPLSAGVGSAPKGASPPSATTNAGWDDEAQLEAFRQIRIRRH